MHLEDLKVANALLKDERLKTREFFSYMLKSGYTDFTFISKEVHMFIGSGSSFGGYELHFPNIAISFDYKRIDPIPEPGIGTLQRFVFTSAQKDTFSTLQRDFFTSNVGKKIAHVGREMWIPYIEFPKSSLLKYFRDEADCDEAGARLYERGDENYDLYSAVKKGEFRKTNSQPGIELIQPKRPPLGPNPGRNLSPMDPTPSLTFDLRIERR